MPIATIPAQAVHTALMYAVVRCKSGEPASLARFAAYDRYPPLFAPTCANPRRTPCARIHELHVGPLQRGDMDRLLRRHRNEAGLAGVRKTWGAGMRQLQAEFGSSLMP